MIYNSQYRTLRACLAQGRESPIHCMETKKFFYKGYPCPLFGWRTNIPEKSIIPCLVRRKDSRHFFFFFNIIKMVETQVQMPNLQPMHLRSQSQNCAHTPCLMGDQLGCPTCVWVGCITHVPQLDMLSINFSSF